MTAPFPAPSRKIAILFRYGAGEHLDFLPALPELARKLKEGGAEVHHFGFRSDRPIPDDLRKEMQIHGLPFRVRRGSGRDKHVKALLWLLCLPFLGRHLKRKGFDTVFVDETLPLSAGLLRASFPGVLAFTIHDFFVEIYLMRRPGRHRLGTWIKNADLRAWRQLDVAFTRVEAAKRYLTAQGVDASRIHVVHDPVDLNQFCPGDRDSARKRFGFASGDLVCVHHGVLHPNKGNLRLVEAMARLRELVPNLKCLMIGDGAEFPALQKRVNELGLEDCVILSGWLPGLDDIAEALRASDIGLVMRSGQEGDHFHVTSTLVHNLASGLPVLAVRLDGISEVLEEGREGFLFDPSCGEEFDEKFLRLARDPELRQCLGRAARATAEQKFNPEKISSDYATALLGLKP